MRVRFRCPIRGDDQRLTDDYCLLDFLFDRSPEKTKTHLYLVAPAAVSHETTETNRAGNHLWRTSWC